ncbi:hypothetical protein QE367_001428 [Microbacterium paludicola]|uniref:Uncharacterized protein n=1 Tax=Microbacterium paludicola TaxID=300019 RepID=A0ABU1I2Q2_9MICO|nr:hypothetical protein [Microbacterium paludicola]MDR6167224.1 hypothetical protein [Microbacterium paludicola]
MRSLTKRQSAPLAAVAFVVLTLTGCTGPVADGEATEPPASAGSTPSPTPTSDARTDEQQLPLPVDEIADWAKTAVPRSSDTAVMGTLSGWLSEHTSPRQTSQFSSLPAGTYQAQVACRGGGTITVTAGPIDSASSGDPVTCDNSTIAFDVTIEQPGVSVTMDLVGDPTVYALSLERTA